MLGNDSDRPEYGDYRSVPVCGQPLLAGLERSGAADASKLAALTAGVLTERSPIPPHRGRPTTRGSSGVFDLLRAPRRSWSQGPDWPEDAAAGREWWRLVTTLMACRAVGRPAYVADAAVPAGPGLRNAVLRRVIRRNSEPISALDLGGPLLDGALSSADTDSAEGLADHALV